MPEAVSSELRRQLLLVEPGVVAFLGFGRRDVADGLQQPAIVEPVDPGQRRELDGFETPPGSAPMDEFGLVEAVDRLCEGVVVGVSDAADGGLDASFRQALGVANAARTSARPLPRPCPDLPGKSRFVHVGGGRGVPLSAGTQCAGKRLHINALKAGRMVGATGIEPATPTMST